MKIHIITDKDHQDSIWFDGLIAETEDFELVAAGEIRIHYTDKDGEYVGMYDGKPRDMFPDIKDDKDLQNENFIWDMNNWFEIMPKEESAMGSNEIAHTYNEAIEILKNMQKEIK